MSHPEMLSEIDRVSGPATRLREIRAALPTARTRRRGLRARRGRRAAAGRGRPEPPLRPRRPVRSAIRSA